MGWVARVELGKPPHNCDMYKPTLQDIILKEKLAPGSVWECPICKKRYLYRGADVGVVRWEEGRAI